MNVAHGPLANFTSWVGRLLASSILRGAASAFSVRIAGTAFAFASSLLMARALGVQQYGLYVFSIFSSYMISLKP